MLSVCLVFSCGLHAENNNDDLLSETQYFSFHNNLWINLHHFLYEKASNGQQKHLQKSGLSLLNIGDDAVFNSMTEAEKNTVESAVEYYKKHMIKHNLLNSGRLLKWLYAQPTQTNDQFITDNKYSEKFSQLLNQLKPLYEQHYWPEHKKLNASLLKNHLETIKVTQASVIEKMQKLSGSQWQQKVRIDLTTYGNWAGAYSPEMDHIVVSSIDPEIDSSLFIELVFHESSHLLFSRQSPFRKALKEQIDQLKLSGHRNLWHAAMFYLAGLATQEALKTLDINHQLFMAQRSIFSRYYDDPHFRSLLKKYYSEEIELNRMVEGLFAKN